MVILLHFDSVLISVIVTKISLSIAISFYALVYDDDDDDYTQAYPVALGRSGRHMSGEKRWKNFLSCRPLFWLNKYNHSFW